MPGRGGWLRHLGNCRGEVNEWPSGDRIRDRLAKAWPTSYRTQSVDWDGQVDRLLAARIGHSGNSDPPAALATNFNAGSIRKSGSHIPRLSGTPSCLTSA